MKNDRHTIKFVPTRLILPGHWLPFGPALAAWQFFVRNLHEYKAESTPYELVNGTSSINNHDPDPIASREEAVRRLSWLFSCAGHGSFAGEFLRYRLDIKNCEDLGREITAKVTTNPDFPNPAWFMLEGREFVVSPNSQHPNAKWISGVRLRLDRRGRLWAVDIDYGYPHEPGWHHFIRQEKGERIGAFVERVDATLNEMLTPEDPKDRPSWRIGRLRDRNERRKAWKNLFWDNFESIGFEDELADALMRITPAGSLSEFRIRLTPERLATLKRWARGTAEKLNEGKGGAA